jgi:tetratricopeptide (TPR) repeat protein
VDFDKAIEIKPLFAEAYYNRGIAYNSLGNYNQSIADLQMAAKLGNKVSRDSLRRQGIHW